MTNWETRAAAYAGKLTADRAITSPAWHAIFASTPRHLFVPRYWALDAHNVPDSLVEGDNPDQHHAWLEAVYTDRSLITRWTASTTGDGTALRIVTSAASQPSVVAVMLDRLALRDGQRVLEIGTGTGYNTALLCSRLGDQNVTSIDIDHDLIAEAGKHLTAAGHYPRLEIGDGTVGLADAAPFDRILATCAISHIPPAWIQQLTPDGRIVAPLTFGGALVVLDRISATEVAGRIDHYPVYFMPLRETAAQPMT